MGEASQLTTIDYGTSVQNSGASLGVSVEDLSTSFYLLQGLEGFLRHGSKNSMVTIHYKVKNWMENREQKDQIKSELGQMSVMQQCDKATDDAGRMRGKYIHQSAPLGSTTIINWELLV